MPEPQVFNAATNQWVHGDAIADPTGGATVDTEARAATNDILSALRSSGVIAGATDLNAGHTWNEATRQVVLGPAIANPTGGATVDTQARAAIDDMLDVLRANGIIAGGTGGPSHVLDEDTNQWASAAIANPTGGTADAELRTALNDALAAMRSASLIAQD